MILNEISLDSPVEFTWTNRTNHSWTATFSIDETRYQIDIYLIRRTFWNVAFKPVEVSNEDADIAMTNNHHAITVFSTVRAAIVEFAQIKKPTRKIGMFSRDKRKANIYQMLVKGLTIPGFTIRDADIDKFGEPGDYAGGVWIYKTPIAESRRSLKEVLEVRAVLYSFLEQEILTS